MNIQTIEVTVAVDVDRQSPEYGRLAVEAIDPRKHGMSSDRLLTAVEIDDKISKELSLLAIQQILNRSLDRERFGSTTVRIMGPKNLQQLRDQFVEVVEEDQSWT